MNKLLDKYIDIMIPCIDCSDGCRGGCWNSSERKMCDSLKDYIENIIKICEEYTKRE